MFQKRQLTASVTNVMTSKFHFFLFVYEHGIFEQDDGGEYVAADYSVKQHDKRW